MKLLDDFGDIYSSISFVLLKEDKGVYQNHKLDNVN